MNKSQNQFFLFIYKYFLKNEIGLKYDVFQTCYKNNMWKSPVVKISCTQVAPNWVKVATDGNIFGDKSFFEVSLKNFLLTSWPCWRYLKGSPWLVLYASKKIVTIRYTDRIIWKEKGSILGCEKMMQRLG